jgi:hypothetical protein
MRIAKPTESVFEGREGVGGLSGMTTRTYDDTGTPKTRHITTNARIQVDREGGSATCSSYYSVTQAPDELPLQLIVTGRDLDTFHRIDGVWWFDSRTMFVDQAGDLSHHLEFDSLDHHQRVRCASSLG